jgi:replicative DNA helicase
MNIFSGEIYGKQTASRFVMYNVIKVSKTMVTLQSIDNPLSLFVASMQKLAASGYVRVSQTPYIHTTPLPSKQRKLARKPTRCPHTLDFLEARADSERPAPLVADLFN